MSDNLRAAALAALEWLRDERLDTWTYMDRQFYKDCAKHTKALEAALAEPAIKESLTVAEQEPVAWKHPDKNMVFWEDTKKIDEYHGFKLTIPLYASPPAAQPEPTCPECKAAVLYECVACSSNNYPPVAQPEQEPVAWTTMPEAEDWCFVASSKDPTGKLQGKWFPLYTAPPRREWVSLTDDEINAIEFPESGTATMRDFVRIIEAKLRERNT